MGFREGVEVVSYYLEREGGGGGSGFVFGARVGRGGEKQKERNFFRSDDGEERRRGRDEGDSSL